MLFSNFVKEGEYGSSSSSSVPSLHGTSYLSHLHILESISRKDYKKVCKSSNGEDLKSFEQEQRTKEIENQLSRRQKYQIFLRAVLHHGREFYSFHKTFQTNVSRVARVIKSTIDQKVQKLEREEDKQDKLRIKALKANDMEAYSKLVAEAKNERLSYLLKQTSEYMESIKKLVMEHRQRVGGGQGGVMEEEFDFLGISSQGEIPRQPRMLVGGDLKEYQLRGLQWMVSLYDNNLNGILADEMGLGKTIQSIALITFIMEIRNNNGPFLIVVPLSTLSNWVNEFKKWSPDIILVLYKGPPNHRKDIYRNEMSSCQFNVLLTTYEYIMKDKHVLRKYNWQYIIVDEGHRMKNVASKFAQTLGSLYTSRNRLLLTGTPLQNSLPELWALLNFLLPTIFNSVDNFEQWFSKPFGSFNAAGTNNEESDLSDEERMLIIHRLHQVLRPFLLRRVKASVMDQLPEKIERVLKCDLSAWQKMLYRRIQEKGALLVAPPNEPGAKQLGSRGLSNILMQLRKVCNHPYLFQSDSWKVDFKMVSCSGKFELLDRMLPKLKAAGHRVLMFSQMTQLMNILEDYFTWRNFRYLRLDGSTSADEREQRMYMFNASDSPFFIFLLSTRAGGLGLNLATADTVILFDSDWNPMMDAQAQDRAHRIGQKNEVRVFRLVTNSPIEEKILARATDKLNMNNLVVEAGKFNNKSQEAERKAMLENLIKLESEEIQEDGDDILQDEQINEMMAVTDEEMALYQRMDKERENKETQEWQQHQLLHHLPPDLPKPPRLMRDQDVPLWLLQADMGDAAKHENLELFDEFNGRTSRKRKDVSYKENFTDSQFTKMIEQDDDDHHHNNKGGDYAKDNDHHHDDHHHDHDHDHDEEETNKKQQKKKKSTLSKKNNNNTNKKTIMNSITTPALNEMNDFYYQGFQKIIDVIQSCQDDNGRLRCELYLVKPSKRDYPDYYKIIVHPIDLKTIQKRITKKKYFTIQEFQHDFQLLFSNAKTYNHPDSLVYQDATTMEHIFEHEFQRLIQDKDTSTTRKYKKKKYT